MATPVPIVVNMTELAASRQICSELDFRFTLSSVPIEIKSPERRFES
jgi:hypothetical protein